VLDRPKLKVTVKHGGDVTGLKFTVARGMTIEGTVVDQRGRPVPQARVCLAREMSYYVLARTNSHGAFRLYGVKPDSTLTHRVVDDELRLGALLGVRVGQRPPEALVVRLAPMSVVTGRVVGAKKAPVAGILAFLYQSEGPGAGELDATRTDEDGCYEFRAAPGIKVSVRTGGDDNSEMSESVLTRPGQRHQIPDRVYRPL